MKKKTKNRERRITILAIVLFTFFVLLMSIGYFGGEADIVLEKARNICMECIGIG